MKKKMYLITLFLSLLLLLLSCNTLEEKRPVEKAKEIQEEVKVKKEEVYIEPEIEEDSKVIKEKSLEDLANEYDKITEDKEVKEKSFKYLKNIAIDGIFDLENKKTTFKYAENKNFDQLTFYSELIIEKRLASKEILITSTFSKDGELVTLKTLFDDGKTYKKNSNDFASVEPNNGYDSSEEYYIMIEGLNQELNLIYEVLDRAEYIEEEVTLEENYSGFLMSFASLDSSLNTYFHFEIKINKNSELEKITMFYDYEDKVIYTLEKSNINKIEHDFY